jgi:uncharacterized protein
MGQALAKIAADNKISSVHVNFCLDDEREALEQVGFFPRMGIQYHWQNRNFIPSMIISTAFAATGATR